MKATQVTHPINKVHTQFVDLQKVVADICLELICAPHSPKDLEAFLIEFADSESGSKYNPLKSYTPPLMFYLLASSCKDSKSFFNFYWLGWVLPFVAIIMEVCAISTPKADFIKLITFSTI